MVNNLFINGCSFLTDWHNGWSKTKYQPTTSGHCLAKLFGLKIIPYAATGRGNNRIISTTKSFFYDNYSHTKDTFALIGWSHVNRSDFLTPSATLSKFSMDGIEKKNKVENGHPGSEWGCVTISRRLNHWDNEFINKRVDVDVTKMEIYDVDKTMRLYYLNQVLCMQDFFKLNKIKYCMYNSLTNFPSVRCDGLDRLESRIDKDRFFKFDTESHCEFLGKSEGLTLSAEDGHPNPKGSLLWAEELEVFIRENNLI